MKDSREIFLEGEKYVTASDAAALCGYTRIYVGQLCRGGKVRAKKFGTDWMVSEKSILDYKKSVTEPPALQEDAIAPVPIRILRTQEKIEKEIKEPEPKVVLVKKEIFQATDEWDRAILGEEKQERFRFPKISFAKLRPFAGAFAAVFLVGLMAWQWPLISEKTLRVADEIESNIVFVKDKVLNATNKIADAVESVNVSAQALTSNVLDLVRAGKDQLSSLSQPEFSLPEIRVPKLSLPEIKLPKFSFPDVKFGLRLSDVGAALALPFTLDDIKLSIADLKDRFVGNLVAWRGYIASLGEDIKLVAMDFFALPGSSRPAPGEGSKVITFAEPSATSTPPLTLRGGGEEGGVREVRTVVERIISGISQAELDQKLSSLNQSVLAQVQLSLAALERRLPSNQVQNPIVFLTTSIPGPTYNSPPQTGSGISASFGDFSSGISTGGNLDASGNVTLGSEAKSVSITSGVWNITSAGAVSGLSSLNTTSLTSGSASLSTLTVSGRSDFASALYASSTLQVTGDATFYGNFAFFNQATTTIPSSLINAFSFATSTSVTPFLTFDTKNYRIGVGTTSPGATFAVSGDILASGGLNVSGASMNVNSTTTLTEQLLVTKAPTVSHTFGTWAVGASGSAVTDSVVVINPASAAADTNLLGIAVGGAVRFLVDADGDVFANGLTTVGGTTLASTTASNFTVENSFLMGDAPNADSHTFKGRIVHFATTTGAAYTMLNSTASGDLLRLQTGGVTDTTTSFVFSAGGQAAFGTTTHSGLSVLTIGATTTNSIPLTLKGVTSQTANLFQILNSGDSQLLTVSSGGNLGVSTSTPSNLFSVHGNGLFSGNLSVASFTATGTLTFTGQGANMLATFNSSNQLVASSTPVLASLVATSTTATSTFAGGLAINGTGFVINQGVAANSFNINASGNLGIGTTSPGSLLSVHGNALISGTITVSNLTATGTISLPATTATAGIIRWNNLDVVHTYGTNNFFAGSGSEGSAGNFTLTGSRTVGIGNGALNGLTSGSSNTCVGDSSCQVVATGGSNVAVGSSALKNGAGGDKNVAIGASALQSLTGTGGRNVAIGYQALYSFLGSSHIAIGDLAFNIKTGGDHGIAIGINAMRLATGGNNNNGIGTSVMEMLTTGNDNNAIGEAAMQWITTGSGNTAVGHRAGSDGSATANVVTTGTNLTYIGYYAGQGTTTQLTNATAIGANAKVDASNSLILGATGANAVNVGIGTTSPFARLSVHANATDTYNANLFSVASSTASATSTLFTVLASGNVGIGTTSPGVLLSVAGGGLFNSGITSYGTLNIPIFNATSTTATSTISGGLSVGNNAAFVVNRGATANSLYVAENGNVGIGTAGPVTFLHIKGENVSSRGQLTLEATDYAHISFYNGPTTGTNLMGQIYYQSSGNIFAFTNNNNNNGGPILFNTQSSAGESMRITSAGNVGIGTTSPVGNLAIEMGTNAFPLWVGDTGTSSPSFVVTGGGNVGIGTTNPGGKLEVASGNVFFGDTSNANMTQGLTINQGGNDNEILALKSSDVAHGIANQETDTYAYMLKREANFGGLTIQAMIESGASQQTAFTLTANSAGAAQTTKSTAGFGLAQFQIAVNNGAVGSNGNLVSIDNNGSTRFIFDAEGTLHQIPGSDTSVDLLTVQVTGTPTLGWDETNDIFTANKGLTITSGNVGIGTTSPASLLAVQGNCVTGDTKLKRRRKRRRKNGKGEWVEEEYFEDTRIDEIKPGDEILTLDEKTGKLVVSRVNKLMEMGTKPIIKLTTALGRTIRTTKEHPYFVKTSNPDLPKRKPRAGVFVDNANLFYAQKKAGWKVDLRKLRQALSESFDVEFVNYYRALPDENDPAYASTIRFLEGVKDVVTIKTKPLKYIEIAKGKYEKKGDMDVEITLDVVRAVDALDLIILVTGDSDFAALREYVLHEKQKEIGFIGFKHNLAWELKRGKYAEFERFRSSLELGVENKATPEPKLGRTLVSLLYSRPPSLSSGGVWTKVDELKEGQEIAVLGRNKKPAWDRIEKIEKLPAEQVWDIEVENTHNFIGNDIVAHNTYVSGTGFFGGAITATSTLNLTGLLTFGNASGTQLTTTGSTYLATSGGNVGIGTTSPWGLLSVEMGTADNAFVVSDQGTSTPSFVVKGSGNVGIGTANPNTLLAVVGTTTIGSLSTATQAGINIGYGGLCVDNDGTCIASTTGRISSVTSTTGNTDVAEIYLSDEILEKGEIVATAGGTKVKKANPQDLKSVVGVVSTDPGVILGLGPDQNAEAGYPIALVGRVPVKVNLESGPIQIGDRITSSSIAGVGMKATTSGQTVGIALEPFDGTQNFGTSTPKILVFVNLGYSKLDSEIAAGETGGWIVDQATGRIKSSYILDMDNHDIVNARNILSASGNWSINENGKLIVREIETQKLTVTGPQGLPAQAGITIYDRATGGPVCVFSENGVLKSEAGACGSTNLATGLPSEATTTPLISDTTPPVITILGNNPAVINVGSAYSDMGVTVTDNVDQNLGYAASVNGGPALSQGAGLSLDTSTTTTHTILYTATDSAGNSATAGRTVNVVEQ